MPNCQHLSLTIKYEGPLEIEICSNSACAKVFVKCEHLVSISEKERVPAGPYVTPTTAWSEDESVLSCTYCGKDVT